MTPIEKLGHGVLQFSGGKDSLACLYLLRPFWDRLTVMWLNSGAAYPETIEQMNGMRKLVPHFVEVQGDQPARIAEYGPPADVVPVRASPEGRMFMSSTESPIQSSMECCKASMWVPMSEAVKASGTKLVIRGQRMADRDKSPVTSGQVFDGIEYWFPLESWTEQDVLAYLKECDVPLPEHYAYVNSSLDCWSCTAYRDHVVGRMRYMREKHPKMHTIMLTRLQGIKDSVLKELSYIEDALSLGGRP